MRIIIYFQGFQEFGSVRTVWGTLAGDDGAADGIPNGPAFGGQKNYLCNYITGPGSVHLYVQLDIADSTADADWAYSKAWLRLELEDDSDLRP